MTVETEPRIYGRPEEDVNLTDMVHGLIDGSRELTEVPPAFVVEGKEFALTPTSIARGLRLAVNASVHGTPYLMTQIESEGSDDVVFEGVQVKRDRFYGEDQDDQLVLLWAGQETGGYYITPSVIEPGIVERLVDRATPETIEDYAYYAKDVLKEFVEKEKVQTFWSTEMDMGYIDSEKWTSHATRLVETIEKWDKEHREWLGDDYSVNESVRLMAAKFFAKAQTSNAPETYAQRFALAWLELRTVREVTQRTRRTYC